MGNKIPSKVYDTKGRVVDVAFSIRRNTKQPLDESSLPLNYKSLSDEMKTSTSSIYKGQIVVTQGPETVSTEEKQSDYYTPFLIKNDGDGNTTYYADRILTATYTNTFLSKEFVKKNQLGTTYTGVGKWPDATEEKGSSTYNEIFNDYNTYKIINNNKGEIPIMSHVEGKANTLSGSFAHIESYNNIGGGDFSHVEGASNHSYDDSSYSHIEGELNFAINSCYAHVEGHSNKAISASSAHVGGSNSEARGDNAFVHGINAVAFENGISIGKSTYAKAGFATGISTASYYPGAFATGYNTIANGHYSVAEGEGSISKGQASHAEGYYSYAYGIYSHTEGSSVTGSENNTKLGAYSHAENASTVLGNYSHAEGIAQVIETGAYAHAEGSGITYGTYSHTEGNNTVTTGTGGHAEGIETNAYEYSHAEGNSSYAKGIYSHAEGTSTMSAGISTHTEGICTSAYNNGSHAEGGYGRVNSDYSHVEGYKTYTTSNAIGSHAEGNGSYTTAEYAHAEGNGTYASGSGAHAEGNITHANGQYSHAEGNDTTANSTSSHAEGEHTKAIGQSSHVEGVSNYAGGIGSHAEGNDTYSNGASSHSQGVSTYANGEGSFASGNKTTAQSNFSSSFGVSTYANGIGSISEGNNTSSYGEYSHSAGIGSISRGSYSSTDGFYTVSRNKTEVGHGTYNRSYYSANGFLVENNDNNKIPNEFAKVGNRYLPGRYPSGQADVNGTYFYDSSYETVFSIGNGGTGDTSKGPDPLYISGTKENKIDAGKYVKNNSRHNIMDIRRNGQMYYDGGMIVGGEIVGPMSYSYVASLGPTAYFTTIMAALLTQPEYYRPTLKVNFNGQRDFNSGATFDIEVGTKVNYSISFTGFRIAYDCLEHVDPIYGTMLGNMLGYTKGITEITYELCPNSYQGSKLQNSSLNQCKITQGKFENEKYVGYLANGLSLGKPLGGGKTDHFAYNPSGATRQTVTYSNILSNDNLENNIAKTGLIVGTEDTYTLLKTTSYSFAEPSQMYFQQLAEKGTYIGAAGTKPTEKWDSSEPPYRCNAITSIRGRYKIYWGTTQKTCKELQIAQDNGDYNNGWDGLVKGVNRNQYNSAWTNYQGANGSINNIDNQTINTKVKTIWIAFPASLYGLCKSSSVTSNYIYYTSKLGTVGLDTGITDYDDLLKGPLQGGSTPLYTYLTHGPIGNCGMIYRVVAFTNKNDTAGDNSSTKYGLSVIKKVPHQADHDFTKDTPLSQYLYDRSGNPQTQTVG